MHNKMSQSKQRNTFRISSVKAEIIAFLATLLRRFPPPQQSAGCYAKLPSLRNQFCLELRLVQLQKSLLPFSPHFNTLLKCNVISRLSQIHSLSFPSCFNAGMTKKKYFLMLLEHELPLSLSELSHHRQPPHF